MPAQANGIWSRTTKEHFTTEQGGWQAGTVPNCGRSLPSSPPVAKPRLLLTYVLHVLKPCPPDLPCLALFPASNHKKKHTINTCQKLKGKITMPAAPPPPKLPVGEHTVNGRVNAQAVPNDAVVRVRQKLAGRLLADILTCCKDRGGREVGSHAPDKPICHLWVDRTGPERYIHTHSAQQAPTPWLLGRPDACPDPAVERRQLAERSQAGPHAHSASQAQTGRTLGGSQKHNIPPMPLRSHSHTRTRGETNTQSLWPPLPRYSRGILQAKAGFWSRTAKEPFTTEQGGWQAGTIPNCGRSAPSSPPVAKPRLLLT